MRRVYYAFALRVATHPLAVQALVLFVSVYALSRLIHVAAIINNIGSLQVRELGRYIFNTLTHTEFLTLLCFSIVFFTLLSLPLRLTLPRYRNMQTI